VILRQRCDPGLLLAALALALLACSAARAEEWVSVWKSDDGNDETFVDVENLRISGDIRTASLKHVAAPGTRRGVGNSADKWVSYQVGRGSFNCADRTARPEANAVHYEDGTVDRYDNPMLERLGVPEPWAPLPDDPIAEAVMRFVCAWKPPQ
jgi:hypothetical protein